MVRANTVQQCCSRLDMIKMMVLKMDIKWGGGLNLLVWIKFTLWVVWVKFTLRHVFNA